MKPGGNAGLFHFEPIARWVIYSILVRKRFFANALPEPDLK
jgi:hypothetical protein